MKIKRILTAVIMFATVLGVAAAGSPKREFRSIWMAAMGIDWPYEDQIGDEAKAKAALIEYIENFKRHNFTGICLHVRPLADALYRSSLEPWSASLTGVRGQDPGWDPLAFAVEECHKRGMEIYAWINPFRIDKVGGVNTTPFDLEWREKGWELKSGNWTIFNPGLPEARQHCLDVMREIYTNYQIDGMLFDDYFYPDDKLVESPAAGDYQLWKDAKSGMSLADWRRNNVNTFVKELYDMIQAERPDMRFGIGPAGTAGKSSALHKVDPPTAGGDWQYDKIYADPLAWLHDGSIDFISPQIYWARSRSDAPFTPIAEWWAYVAEHFGRHNYVSMASYKVNTAEFGGNNETGWNEFVEQVKIGRSNAHGATSGQIYYSAKQFDGPEYSGLGDWLGSKAYQRPALVPVVDWKEHTVYDAPANLRHDGSALNWDAVPVEGRTIMRYSVYAVPLNTTAQEAMDPDGDGISGDYLIDVSYSTTYTLPEQYRSRHWYAVCAYDGYGYESEPALADYSDERSVPTAITYPAAGEAVVWDFTPAWKEVAGAEYCVEVSNNADFTQLRFVAEGVTGTSTTFDLSDLPDNTTLYLRVASCEKGKLYSYTEPVAFRSPTRTAGAQPALTSPDVAPTDAEVTLSWTAVPDAERYAVIIRHKAVPGGALANELLHGATIDAPATSLTLNRHIIGYGDIEWTVTPYGRRFNAPNSVYAIFTAPDLPLGATEPGYAVATEELGELPAGPIVNSVWYRSTADTDSPLAFVDGGSLNRSMVATRDYVYIAGRTADEKDADIYLWQYDALTGQFIRKIELENPGPTATLPCNQLLADGDGGIYIANQTSSVRTYPIVVYKVDLSTGGLTECATLRGTTPTSTRVDHISMYFDFEEGKAYYFAAVHKKSALIRWTVEDGEVTETLVTAAKAFTGGAKNFGDAPAAYAVDATHVWVDTSNGVAALYDITTGNIVDRSLEGMPEIAGAGHKYNGMARFLLGDEMYYAFATGTAGNGPQVRFAKGSAALQQPTAEWSGMALPRKQFGTADEAEGALSIQYVDDGCHYGNLYVYSPGNGLACYGMAYNSGVEDITGAGTLELRIEGRVVVLSQTVDRVDVYSLSGAHVATASNTVTIEVPGAGAYIVRAGAVSRLVIAK